MKKLISRDEYLRYLISHKDLQIIKVVSGVRRCGKSTLFEIYKNYLLKNGVNKIQIISINLESIEYNFKDYKELYFYIKSRLIPNKMTYIFLDEIQNIEHFEKAIDSLFILSNVDIYITGSNAYFMSGELATLLSGRYVELKMLPLSFKEYVSAFDKPVSLIDAYNKYITFSSFPFTLNYLDNFEAAQDYLNSLLSTILIKDIVQRYKINNITLLNSVINYIFSNIGNRISTNKIANTLKSNGKDANDKTVEKYLTSLEDSLLIYEAKRYNIKGKEILKTLSKYYVVDLGLRYSLCGIKGQDEGHILENIVYLELLRRKYTVYVGQNELNEIDFVAKKDNEIIYYQVAMSIRSNEVYKRETKPLKDLKDSYKKYVLTMDDMNNIDDEGITIMYVLKWLINE